MTRARQSGEARPRRAGRGYQPRELRVKLYEEVRRLRSEGLSHGRIVEEIWRRFRVRLFTSSISEWLRWIHSPYNGRQIPSLELLEPSEELAYVIGVVMGDGYACRIRKKQVRLENYINRVDRRPKPPPPNFSQLITKYRARPDSNRRPTG